MFLEKIQRPFVLTIFGASGDLARLKIFPALYDLMEQKRFPKDFYIVGFARTKKTDQAFREEFEKSILVRRKDANRALVKKLLSHVHYFVGQYDRRQDYERFNAYCDELTRKKDLTKIVYFSVPPMIFKSIIRNMGVTKRSNEEDIRLVIEKPFGQDVASAKDLFHYVARYFKEEQVYLLDHYLGKAAVQSILNLRHANRLLNLIMKGHEIANIQITAFEDFGVADRIGYFEQVGTLKDMVQSHLLQVLALITMSIPITERAESLHREKYSILAALKFPHSKKNIVFGQYESYRNLKGIAADSRTETFVGLRLFIDRETWFKVPIYIRTGKMLHEKHTYVVIELKKFAFQDKSEPPNRVVIELTPEERLSIKLVNKVGKRSQYQDVTTSDTLSCGGDDCLPEHGLLLLDVIRGNKAHFLSFPEIIVSWELMESIGRFVKNNPMRIETYKDRSNGPDSQHQLTEIDGFRWFDIH